MWIFCSGESAHQTNKRPGSQCINIFNIFTESSQNLHPLSKLHHRILLISTPEADIRLLSLLGIQADIRSTSASRKKGKLRSIKPVSTTCQSVLVAKRKRCLVGTLLGTRETLSLKMSLHNKGALFSLQNASESTTYLTLSVFVGKTNPTKR